MTLREEIERLGGCTKLAEPDQAEEILRRHGDLEVRPYLVTGKDGGLFVICGGDCIVGFNVMPERSSRLHFYIVRDDMPSRHWDVCNPLRGPKPSDVLRLVTSA